MKQDTELNIYELMKDWFSFCYDNPEQINPNHSAMYFFILQHCNTLGWKRKFGLPRQMAMDAIGIKNYKTFSKTFNDLIDWGFILLLQKSENQYSANVIGLVKNTIPSTKSLAKASLKHSRKQVQTIAPNTTPGIALNSVCIDKHITNTPITELEEKKITQEELFHYNVPIGKLEEYMNSDYKWSEKLAREHKLTLEETADWIKKYVIKLELDNISEKNKNECFGHCNNWMKGELKKYGATKTGQHLQETEKRSSRNYED